MTELLTAEEIESLKTISRFESWKHGGFDLNKIVHTIETQQAQIKGLVGALEFYMNPEIYLLRATLRATVMTGAPISNAICDAGKIATQALSASFLEREKAREAVVSAAVDSATKTKAWKGMTMMSEIIDPEIPLKAQKAYEMLEKAVEALK